MTTPVASKKHLRFLNQIFRNPVSHTFCQDVELKCCNGSLLYNKLLVGLVFPELKSSREFQLSIAQNILLPQFTLQELFDKFNAYFVDLDESQNCKSKIEDSLSVNEEEDSIEEIVTEFIVDDLEYMGDIELGNGSDNLIPSDVEENLVESSINKTSSKCKCTTCGEEFMHKSSLCRHMKHKHSQLLTRNANANTSESKGYICKVCSKVFKFKTHLHSHENTHTKPFKCGHCSETFADDGKRASHELNLHGELVNGCSVTNNLNKCSFCPKVFPAKSQLVLHERTHTKEKPFQCSQCDKKFSAKCNLTAHERIHFGESKIYECRHPPCTRKFSHTSERKDHETIHTGDKPHMCPYCGERYRRNANLWRHKKKCPKSGQFVEVESKMIVEEDTDFIVHDPRSNSTTKYELVFVDTKRRKSEDDILENVASEQIVIAS